MLYGSHAELELLADASARELNSCLSASRPSDQLQVASRRNEGTARLSRAFSRASASAGRAAVTRVAHVVDIIPVLMSCGTPDQTVSEIVSVDS